MEHLLLKAATTVTDEGVFEAVISTASIDRDGDIVEPRAIAKALTKWAALGKMMPLVYSHRDQATGQAVIVGHIDPASARVEGNEVISKGWVDQSTERGAETWRLVKSGTLSFSYGYLVPDGGATKRAGKKTGYHITEIDLYEISVVPVGPANNDTRVLSFKSAEELRADSERIEREVTEARLVEDVPPTPTPDPEPTLEERLTKQLQEITERLGTTEQALADLKKKAEETDKPAPVISVDPLRQRSEELALEIASGGMSLRKPPAQVKAPPKDPVDTGELKQRSRDLMFEVLSYSTETP